jgi:hypothetical protein
LQDTFGMMTDVALLDHSLNTVLNKPHMQFDTIRKTRSAISNFERTGDSEVAHPPDERMDFTDTSMYILWFDRVVVGCHIRMGDDIRPHRAMSIELLLEIQRELEIDLEWCSSLKSILTFCLQGTFLFVGFCAGPIIFLALRGRMKGETLNEECHLIPIFDVTRSGLKPSLWVGMMLEV